MCNNNIIIDQTARKLGEELKLNIKPEYKMKVDKITGDFVRLGVSNWDHHAGGDWLGTGRITAKCDELGIPYMLGEVGNEYIIIDKNDLSKLDIQTLGDNFSAACEYPARYFKTEPNKSGKYLFVSDCHGFDQNLADELTEIAQNSLPEIVFFIGDIAGNELLDINGLHSKFYNVFNPMKKLSSASDEEILIAVGEKVEILWNFLNDISPMEPVDRVQWAKEIVAYEHYGHFVSNLPTRFRQILSKDLLKNAQLMYDIMKKFTRRGCLVVLIEGNWDARTPLDFQVGSQCLPTPTKNRLFSFRKFILSKRNKQVIYVDSEASIETDDLIFQLISFDGIMNYTNGSLRRKPETDKIVSEQKKPLILVSHVQAAWEAVKKQTAMTNESKKISEKIWSVISDLEPNYMVHGHLHDKLVDELGNECGGYQYWKFNHMKTHYLPIRTTRFIDFK